LFFGVVLLSITIEKTFCYGRIGKELSRNYYKYANGKVREMIEDGFLADDSDYTISFKHSYTYLQNGLVLIQIERFVRSGPSTRLKYLCYNECFNENIVSNIRLNEMIELVDKFVGSNRTFDDDPINITYSENVVEIDTAYDLIFSKTESKTILTFDPITKRLKTIQKIMKDSKEDFAHEFKNEYDYDNFGRLRGIYKIYEQGKVLSTAYYYDGELRLLPKPYYLPFGVPNMENMIIYDGDILKYHIQVKTGVMDGVSIYRANIHYVIFEFDGNRNEIKQTSYYEKSERQEEKIIIYNTGCIELDDQRNWTHIQKFENGKLAGEFYRKMTYW
jgi:hypothetical protein